MTYEITDRYDALGIPRPDPETMCKGDCEGVGVYPYRLGTENETEAERRLWNEAHNAPEAHADGECDGWHFISCSDCSGTGRRTGAGEEVVQK